MTEEIIIDGVNVAGCKDYDDGTCCNDDVLTLSCEKTNCMHKQLIRLEQENKKLKEAYNEISNNSEILHENNCLRIANAKLSEDLWQHGISMREWREQSLKYRSALEEINLILDELKQQYDYMSDYSEIKEIKEKIDEVLK